MNSITFYNTIKVLRSLFARHGLSCRVVTDNGPRFTSFEFSDFVSKNGVMHSKSAPYHPSTNGLAERFVQTLNNFLRTVPATADLHDAVQRFLLTYRSTPHSITNYSPAYLLLNRKLRLPLDLLKPQVLSKVELKQSRYQEAECKPVSNFAAVIF